MGEADEALLAAIRGGDERALTAVLSRHAPRIYRFGLKMCGDPEDAKDVLQETLLAAARGLREFRGSSSLSTWLYTVARSFCIKARRASKHAPENPLSMEGAGHLPTVDIAPDEAAAGRELGAALDRAIASLDPARREVLILRDVEGLTAQEVAEVLGVSVEAVKSRLHRARAQVRADLEPLLPPGELSAKPPAPGGCPDVVALFSRHLEGEIGPAQCEAMELHLASCKRCGAACESLKSMLALCQADSSGAVAPQVQELVRDALRRLTAQTR